MKFIRIRSCIDPVIELNKITYFDGNETNAYNPTTFRQSILSVDLKGDSTAMANVAIVADSVSNLPADLVKQYGIHIVPAIVNWEGQSLLDGVDITTEAFYKRLQTSSELPKTSQPSPGQFAEVYEKLTNEGKSIVTVTVSEKLSGTYASANLALQSMEGKPIEIVDSRSASLGQGLLVLAAARMAAEGHSHTDIAAHLRTLVPRMRVIFVVDTLDYLHKGGRIGGAQRLVGSILSIKPVLHIEDGRVEPFASIRTKSKAIQHMLDTVTAEAKAAGGPVRAGIIHANAPEAAEDVARRVREAISPVELIVTELSPTIGTNVGPGTVGVGFYTEG